MARPFEFRPAGYWMYDNCGDNVGIRRGCASNHDVKNYRYNKNEDYYCKTVEVNY